MARWRSAAPARPEPENAFDFEARTGGGLKIAASVAFCYPLSQFHKVVGIELPKIPDF